MNHRSRFVYGIVAVVAAVSGFVYLSRNQGVALQQSGPIRTVKIQFKWTTLLSEESSDCTIDCPNQHLCQATGQRIMRERHVQDSHETYTTYSMTLQTSVPYELVQGLNAALINLNRDDAPHASLGPECTSYSDDYPDVKVDISFESGQSINLASWCNTRIPWVVSLNDTTYVQKTGQIAQAYRELAASINLPYGH